jgi:serine/threonine protein kinase/Tfp pilus assembly protein PilF
MTGQTISHYRILEKLGEGGLGVVFKAEDLRLARPVALKLLPEEVERDPVFIERFLREARAASSLNHPHIRTIYQIGEHDGRHFMAMELLEGQTLREHIQSGPINLRDMAAWATQVADGLAAAHAKGIVHRDIKPANIFITERREAKVLDFGLAKVAPTVAERTAEVRHGDTTGSHAGHGLTVPGAPLGTLSYMSPEQARGEPLDARTDVFSFGAVLYEMATGAPAFAGATPAVIHDAVLNRTPAAASTLNPDLPVELERIINQALEKDPESRYASGAELHADLWSFRRTLESGKAVRTRSSGVPAFSFAEPRRRGRVLAAVVLLAALAAGIFLALRSESFRRWFRAESAPRPIQSLAVLPLTNLGGNPEQEYFADGVTEALISTLARIPELRVISRTSVMRYKNVQRPLPEIARELNVDAIVEGSVIRQGSRVRITAQLIEAASDRHLWARSYDRELEDILALQGEVARAIADEIRVTLSPQLQARLSEARRVSPEVYEAYLTGRSHLARFTPEGFRRALEAFERAVAGDPGYAPAHAGIAYTHLLLSHPAGVIPAREAMPRARAAALRALSLDDTLADAHIALGGVQLFFDWEWEEAGKSFRRAMELNRSQPAAHGGYAFYLTATGRPREATRVARTAVELDPFARSERTAFAAHFAFARDYAGAIEQLRRTLELDPRFAIAYHDLAWIHALQERYAEAVRAKQREWELLGAPAEEGEKLRQAFEAKGPEGFWRTQLDFLLRRAETSYAAPHAIAMPWAALNEKDRAFQWLERGFAERDGGMIFLKVAPWWDNLRGDPRFEGLLRRMKFPG